MTEPSSNDRVSDPPRFTKSAALTFLLVVFWASPWTLLGLMFGCLGLVTGGQVQRVGRVLEFSGGWIVRLLRYAPFGGGASAITLGHTVLAIDHFTLDRTRNHERVHVRQYERWGLLFIPAYFLSGLYMWMAGRNPYFDNPFEREAFRKSK